MMRFYAPKWCMEQVHESVRTKKRLDKMSKRKKVGEYVKSTKTEILKVRMTAGEKAALQKQAALNRQNMSEYIRSVAKKPPDVTRDEFDEAIVRMIYEINKIGVNINQIAKKYNEHKYIKPSEDLLDKLDELNGMLKKTILFMKGGSNVVDY